MLQARYKLLPESDTTNSVSRAYAVLLSTALSLLFIVVYGGCNALASRRADVGMCFFAWELRIPFVPALIV
ncbi:MAG TPA: serine/threonine protein phosphatase, partial [Blastocatellia bacterium]|nr:serine/threonine protein phosphatase [Blastocatellia bacterium]